MRLPEHIISQSCGWYRFSPVDLKSLYSMNRSFRHRRSVWNLTLSINPHVSFCSGNGIALLIYWYFGAQYLSLLSRCLRLATNVTTNNSKLTSGGVVSSFPDRISTCIISSPCRAHYLTPLWSNLARFDGRTPLKSIVLYSLNKFFLLNSFQEIFLQISLGMENSLLWIW